MRWQDYIQSDPAIMHGRPCIKGIHVPVSVILDHLAAGMPADVLLDDYPGLTREAISAALAYGAALARRGIERTPV